MVEMLVAITLLGLISAAVVPMLITGIRASVVAKLDTGAKNLSQKRFELMRNLPFRIAYDPAISTGVDMLDTYFPNLLAPSGGFDTAGYVTTQARRNGEPVSGPFYRTRFDIALGSTTYTQYVATQFLTPDTTPNLPVTPPSSYSTTSVGNDRAPSTLVGVTVVTEWTYGTQSKRYTVYTEISDVAPGAPLVTLQARATALRITSTVGLGVDQTDLLLESGVANIDGGLSSGATAASTATGGFASSTPGVRVSGASASAQAPPDVPAGSASDPNYHDLSWQGSLVARVPRSSVDGVAAKTSFGEPIAGTSAAPVTGTSLGTWDMRFTNLPNIDNATFGFDPSNLYIARQPAGSSTEQARATAYAGSVGGTGHSTTVGTSARTSVVNLLQTTFAPDGLIQVQLNSASMTCAADGTTATSTPAYSAQIRFWRYSFDPAAPSGGSYSWTAWTDLNSAQASDPLATVDLTQGPGGVPVGYNNGRVLYLGEYVQGLASQTAGGLAASQIVAADANKVEARATTMVSLSTVPLRTGEDLSAVNIGLGVMSCIAEDNR